MKDELIEAKKYTKLLQEQKEIANEKVEAIRLQFTEKYKGKQERYVWLVDSSMNVKKIVSPSYYLDS